MVSVRYEKQGLPCASTVFCIHYKMHLIVNERVDWDPFSARAATPPFSTILAGSMQVQYLRRLPFKIQTMRFVKGE